jgi:hypothetical protein
MNVTIDLFEQNAAALEAQARAAHMPLKPTSADLSRAHCTVQNRNPDRSPIH